MTQNKDIEKIAYQLHGWYLEATARTPQGDFNPKAQVAYGDLSEAQKDIDRYIAKKVLSIATQARKQRDREVDEWVEEKIHEYPYHDERFAREALKSLQDFLKQYLNP